MIKTHEKRRIMRSMIVGLFVILFLGCATTSNTHSSAEPNSKNETEEPLVKSSDLEKYDSYIVNLSLSENISLLQKLSDEEISLKAYDSLLLLQGREGVIYQLVDQLICKTKSDSVFREIIKADYFIQRDSLLQTADERIDNLLKIDSTNAALYFYLGISQNKQNDFHACVENLQQAKLYSDSLENGWLSAYIAKIYLKEGDQEKAILEFVEGFRKSTKYMTENWSDLYELYIKTEQYGNALQFFLEVESLSNNAHFKSANWIALNNLYWLMNDLSASKELCNEIRNPSNYIDVSKELIYIAILENDFSTASDILEELSPPSINTIFFSSSVEFIKFDASSKHYIKTLGHLRNETKKPIHNEIADMCYGMMIIGSEMYGKNGDQQDQDILRKGLAYLKKSDLKGMFSNYVIGCLLQEMDENQAAIDYYELIPTGSKYYPYSQINLSELFKLEEPSKSLKYLITAQMSLPNNNDIITEVGDFYYLTMKDYANAIKWYRKAVENDPGERLRPVWIADSYLQQGDTKNAQITIIKAIDKILTSDAVWSQDWYLGIAYKIKGDIFLKLEEWEDAKREYENAINYNPRDMDQRLALGEVMYKLKNLSGAEEIFLTVIDSSSTGASINYQSYNEALSSLSMHYVVYDPNTQKLEDLFETAITHFPNSAWCHRILGLAYKNQGYDLLAKQSLIKSMEIDPENIYAHTLLAEIYAAEKQFSMAIEQYKIVCSSIENQINAMDETSSREKIQANLSELGESYSTIADLYKSQGENQKAIWELKKAISALPDTMSGTYRNQLANIYFEIKEFKSAAENWVIVYNNNSVDLSSLFNLALSYWNIDGIDNLIKARDYFQELLVQIQVNPSYKYLEEKSKSNLQLISNDIERIEWPEVLSRAADGRGVTSNIATLFELMSQYNDINNMWLDGVKATTPNKEYLEYSKTWITKSYNVDAKIFQSESLCDRFASLLSSLNIQDKELAEVSALWISAAKTRKEGIAEHSKGFYVSSKEYTGEYERGRAKIAVADTYFKDGLKILYRTMERNGNIFSNYGLNEIQRIIEYYDQKE